MKVAIKWLLIGFFFGMFFSVAYGQLYPGISPDQRDMTLERYWRNQQFENMLQEQQRHWDNWDWRNKPC